VQTPDEHLDAASDALAGLLSDVAARAYIQLLLHGQVDHEEVDADVRAELLDKDFATVLRPTMELQAFAPEIALVRTLRRRTREWLSQSPDVESIARATNLLASVAPGPAPQESVDYPTPSERQKALEELQRSARREVWILQSFEEWLPDEWHASRHWSLTPDFPSKDFKFHIVYDKRHLRFAPLETALEHARGTGVDVRITDEPIPAFLMVVDRRVAAFTPTPAGVGRLSSEPGLVGLLMITCEAVWANAVPIAGRHELTVKQQATLALVGLGYNNKQMAGELGCDVRTVRRRVDELMSFFGVADRAGLVRIACHTHG
jgi:DNA-binding CsgD family transcriptional regulator